MTQTPGYPPPDLPYQTPPFDRDAEHLKILSICWYVWSSLSCLGFCFGSIYLAIGIGFLVSMPPAGPGEPPPEVFGGMFAAIGGCGMLLTGAVATLGFITAGSLRKRRRRTLCFVTSCLACLNIPLGTVLGVFTLVVLSRPSVKDAFV